MNNPTTLAVIGGGPAAVSFLRFFVEKVIQEEIKEIKLFIFEGSGTFGKGLAFQDDLSILIEHGSIQVSSINPDQKNEFEQWINKKPKLFKKAVVESDTESDRRSYIARHIYGAYIEDVFNLTIDKAYKAGISITLIKENVCNISKINNEVYNIELSKSNILVNYVVLCTGNNKPEDMYNLNQTPCYVNEPYPIRSKLSDIPPDKSVAIIGNSLTAVDVAISLEHFGHSHTITMLTRSNVLLKVRGAVNFYSLKYLNEDSIRNIKYRKGIFTLRDALRLLRKELSQFNLQWKPLFFEDKKEVDFICHFENEILEAKEERKWQTVMLSMSPVIEFCWNNLDYQSKRLMLERFNRTWLNARSPIPILNAKKLLHMALNNKVASVSGLNDIQYCHKSNKYIAYIGSNNKMEFDFVINATGSSRHIGEEDYLMNKIIDNGIARKNDFGGIDVDFDSSSVIDRYGNINHQIRAIGHNVQGVYFYMNALGMISTRSRIVANDIGNRIINQAKNVIQ